MRSFLFLITLAFVSSSVHALEAITPEIKSSILKRCRSQMENHGASLVKACTDQDLEAAKALITYSRDDSTIEIISRCESSMSQHGWSLVKSCVDQDIEAKKAVVQLEKEHNKIVAFCIKRMKSYGWSLVKACVDQDIEAEEALKKF